MKLIENPKDGTWNSEADYIVRVGGDLDWDALRAISGNGQKIPYGSGDGDGDTLDDYITATWNAGDSSDKSADVNGVSYFKWQDTDNGVFYFKAAGAYGGEDVRTTFEFFTADGSRTTGIVSVLGIDADEKTPGTPSDGYELTVANAKTMLTISDVVVPDGCTVLALYKENGGNAGDKINSGEVTLIADEDADGSITNKIFVEVQAADGVTSVKYLVEITRLAN